MFSVRQVDMAGGKFDRQCRPIAAPRIELPITCFGGQ